MDPNASGSEPDLTPTTPAPEPKEPLRKPTPEESEKVESMLRHYLLLKNRDDKVGARRVLDEMVELAPGHRDVALARAEDYTARLQSAKAREVVKEAIELYPDDVRLENLYAELVLKASGFDRLSTSDYEKLASYKSAAILSAVVPGLGQVVVGEFVRGATIFTIWLFFTIWFVSMPGGMAGLANVVGLNINRGGPSTSFNPMALLALFGMAVTWSYGFTNLSARAKRSLGAKIDFPTPPVDKPF